MNCGFASLRIQKNSNIQFPSGFSAVYRSIGRENLRRCCCFNTFQLPTNTAVDSLLKLSAVLFSDRPVIWIRCSISCLNRWLNILRGSSYVFFAHNGVLCSFGSPYVAHVRIELATMEKNGRENNRSNQRSPKHEINFQLTMSISENRLFKRLFSNSEVFSIAPTRSIFALSSGKIVSRLAAAIFEFDCRISKKPCELAFTE